MRDVYLFNPENDLALANGNENYEAPLSARLLRNDLALLPLWYAGDDALILTYSEISDSWLSGERKALNINNVWTDIESFEGKVRPDDRFIPWGWSPAVHKLWKKLGFSMLPQSGVDFARYKEFSHRAFTIEVLNKLREKSLLPEKFQLPEQFFSLSEVQNYSKTHFPVLWKAPWSGSGRGLFWNYKLHDGKVEQWVSPVLQKQKSVIAEPVYRKVKDFAMQFYSDGVESVSFAGYSLFLTDIYGSYKGNRLEKDDFIERKLAQYLPTGQLKEVREELSRLFSFRVASSYRGYFGVDMMICASSGNSGAYFLHPCVEINFRMNMGMTCRLFYDRYVLPGSHGIFSIDYSAEPCFLYQKHIHEMEKQPLRIEKGRIRSGYLSLSPVKQDTHYRAYATLVEI